VQKRGRRFDLFDLAQRKFIRRALGPVFFCVGRKNAVVLKPDFVESLGVIAPRPESFSLHFSFFYDPLLDDLPPKPPYFVDDEEERGLDALVRDEEDERDVTTNGLSELLREDGEIVLPL
jgi:hypothetical protein